MRHKVVFVQTVTRTFTRGRDGRENVIINNLNWVNTHDAAFCERGGSRSFHHAKGIREAKLNSLLTGEEDEEKCLKGRTRNGFEYKNVLCAFNVV